MSIADCLCLRDLRNALILAAIGGREVEIITCARRGKPSRFRGFIVDVTCGTVELCLSKYPHNTRAVFSLCQIIGFTQKPCYSPCDNDGR